MTQPPVTVVGGGLAGLVAAIACAEGGAEVHLYEAHATLGGRWRATTGNYIAHQGPHVLYNNGPLWHWLANHDLIDVRGVPTSALAGFWFRRDGRLRHTLPLSVIRLLADRRRPAPVADSYRDWATRHYGAEAARVASNMAGVVAFDADPGRLSAAFVAERLRRAFSFPPGAHYVAGGWNRLIDRMAARAREVGVRIEVDHRIEELPETPVIIATTLAAARRLLPQQEIPEVPSGHTVLLDVAVRARRGDAFVVSDTDDAGWLERFSAPDPSLAPAGESLIQAQLPLRPGESKADALTRLEAMVDLALPDWRSRLTWRQDSVARDRTGALDLPGTTWRDRPAIDRGAGVYLVGDQVAAPGLLSEVSCSSALTAGEAVLRSRAAAL
jgi:phytoene dehydrogenase-like protein